ncbi:MAG: Y-family DNA polymerase [Treponema sp.]|nr:Y-family DNA polymerase [Treponema sp.]
MIMHVDANSFYASCERIFRPDLNKSPIAVLSNNDGITISLDSICCSLGFRRGDVYFRKKPAYSAKNVAVFSSNYTLYADISMRLNLLYNEYAPETEQYSIDESFLFYPDWKNISFTGLAEELRTEALRQIHIPVSVGIAPTKTLAKMCNKLAKKYGGVCNWHELDGESVLSQYPASDVWGIGPSKADVLSRLGVHTAYDLANFPLEKAKKYLSITGFRTVQELNGIPSQNSPRSEIRQNISVSKSFARGVTAIEELETALAEYTQLAVTRMRSEGSACTLVSIYLMTARAYGGINKDKEYFNSALARLPCATSYLPSILQAAVGLMHSVYRKGYSYRKIMVSLIGLEKDMEVQHELFKENQQCKQEKYRSVMGACDFINEKYGRGTIHPCMRDQTDDKKADGTQSAWIMQRSFLSPSYTTRFSGLPEVF